MKQVQLPGLERNEAEKLYSDSDELYTPAWLIKSLGEIGLDPCSNYTRQFAKINYTKDDDGLELPWETDGLAYCNPPYNNPLQERFCRKAHKEWFAGNFGMLVMLIQARVETKYWHECVWPMASWVGFPQGRIAFVDKNGEGEGGGSFASAIIIAKGSGSLFDEVMLEGDLIDACSRAGHEVKWIRP